MQIQILPLLKGAKQARGLTVIIDVFRAFSLEAYLQYKGVKEILPVQSIAEAMQLKKDLADVILIGERNGIKVEGFDYGNSPSEVMLQNLQDKVIVHTTSAGVQGLIAADKASEIVTGALVNAKATCQYIEKQKPTIVSLVPMGWNGIERALEDDICAEYMLSLLQGEKNISLEDKIRELKKGSGSRFFYLNLPQFPTEDFALCTSLNRFSGVNRAIYKNNRYHMVWEEVHGS